MTHSLRPLSEIGLSDALIWGLVDAAPDGIVMTGEHGRILLVNHRAEELFGYDRSELLGKPVEMLVPERFQQVHRAHRTRYRAEPRTRPMGLGTVLYGRRRDGSEFPVEISLSPLRDGPQLHVVASVRDVTERIAAEAAMRQIHDVLDAARDAILISDPETLRFTYVNQGAVDQVGYSRDELATMTILHLAPELTESQLREILAPLERGEERSTTFVTTHRRRDGTDLPVEVLLQVLSDDHGHPQAVVAIVRDVTQRLESEERLRQANEDLRLLQERDRIARDLHDNVIQRLFAAGMAMQGLSSVVRGRDPVAASRIDDIVDEIDATIREIRGTIYGLQHRASAGRAGVRHDILRVLEAERPALDAEPRLRLDGVLDAIHPEVSEHLLATLREALSNVARHAQAANVEVTVEAHDEVVLRVVDDGVGLPESRPEGNGLRNMAERARLLGGRCRVEAGPHGGTVLEWVVPKEPARVTTEP